MNPMSLEPYHNINEQLEGDPLPHGHAPNLSIFGATFLICATIMGAGIIGIPQAMNQVGWVLGIILLLFFVVLTVLTIEWLIKAGELVGARTYEELGTLAFGTKGKYVVCLAMMGYIFGALVAFLVIMGDLLTPVLQSLFDNERFSNRHMILLFLVTFLILPLSLLRNLSKLESFSFFAVLIIVVFSIFLIIDGFITDNIQMTFSSTHTFNFSTDFFIALPVISLAYTCQSNVFPIYLELRDPSIRKMRLVSIMSGSLCGMVYLFAGLFGYLAFGDKTDGDVFINFPTSGVRYNVMRSLFCLSLIVHYPVTHFAFRKSLEKILFGRSEFSWTRHIIETVITIYLSLLLEVLLPSVTQVFGLTGSIGSFLIAFVLPSAIYLKVMPGKWNTPHLLVAWIVLVISLVLMAISIVVNTISVINYFK